MLYFNFIGYCMCKSQGCHVCIYICMNITLLYIVIAESLMFRPSSTVKSKLPIANCFLLSEIKDDSRYHGRLALKHVKQSSITMEDLDKIEEYTLSDIAMLAGVNDRDTNEMTALGIIKKYIGSAYEYQTNAEPKIGDTNISKLKECYISTNSNKGDVMVSFEGSNVLYIEVHSSGTYDCTARKTVYLLMECLRMLKAFGVMQPKMDAFVFPCKEYRKCVVKLSMRYLPDLIQFQYSFRCLQIHEISAELKIAVKSNKAMCQNVTIETRLNIDEARFDCIVWLTAEERQKWGFNLRNAKSGFGILLMNNDVCLKKPIFTESFNMLFSITELQECGKITQHMPIYSFVVDPIPPMFIQYNKITHKPLSSEEGKRCSLELVKKVTKAIQGIHHVGYMHKDLRLANICFDSNFDPILIGFDLSTIYIQSDVDVDMEKFAGDLIKCFEDSQTAQADLFIQEYAKGRYFSTLLKTSILSTGISSVQSVINDRNVSQ